MFILDMVELWINAIECLHLLFFMFLLIGKTFVKLFKIWVLMKQRLRIRYRLYGLKDAIWTINRNMSFSLTFPELGKLELCIQADLRLCWSHIPQCWKSQVAAQSESLRETRAKRGDSYLLKLLPSDIKDDHRSRRLFIYNSHMACHDESHTG